MRIAFVGCRHLLSDYSGIERGLIHLGPELVRMGHEVTVFGSTIADPSKSVKRYEGVDIEEIRGLSGKHSETLSRTALSVVSAIKRRFDVVHFTHQGPGIFLPFTRLAGAASVITAAGLDWRRDKWGKLAKFSIKTAERVAVHCADEIIVLARSHQDYFERGYGRHTVRIPNGIVPKTPPHSTRELAALGLRPRGYALFAARLVPEKGCHELVTAWNALATDKKLVIAGAGSHDGGYVADLKRMADPTKILFVGHVGGERLEQLFANAYLFLLPSHLEGLSMALLEAIAYGVPALVSDIPENLEVVEDNGFVFRTGDVASLRTELAGLLEGEARVCEMAERVARAARQKSSWKQVAARHNEVYGALVDRQMFQRRKAA